MYYQNKGGEITTEPNEQSESLYLFSECNRKYLPKFPQVGNRGQRQDVDFNWKGKFDNSKCWPLNNLKRGE